MKETSMKKTYLQAIITTLFLVVAGYMVFQFAEDRVDPEVPLHFAPASSVLTSLPEVSPEQQATVEARKEERAVTQDELMLEGKYEHEYGFSFRHPINFTATSFAEGEGESIVVQDTNKGSGFQVYVVGFSGEDTSITPQLLARDIPDMEVIDPQPISLGGGNSGLAFITPHENGEYIREVWFILNGYLYQISGFADLDPLISAVLQSFRFF